MIKKSAEMGFCYGVREAVESAYALKEKISSEHEVYLLGELVNNSNVVRDFQDAGFFLARDVSEIPDGSIVVIRAHGVGRSVYAELKKKNVTIEDFTCVNIRRTHKIVNKMSSKGYDIIVIGKHEHPEVVGIKGWCNDSVYIVENESDLTALNLSENVCVVAQTTINKKMWEYLISLILVKNSKAKIKDTLCNATEQRQFAAQKLALNVDMIIVIGDKKSSNSQELFNCCMEYNKKSFIISSLADLSDMENSSELAKCLSSSNEIGLTASASTPENIVNEVFNYLTFTNF